jgi:hypothetical protein
MVGFPESPPLLEAEDLDVLPSPQPASKVIRPISPTNELRFFLKPSMFAPVSAYLDEEGLFAAPLQSVGGAQRLVRRVFCRCFEIVKIVR